MIWLSCVFFLSVLFCIDFRHTGWWLDNHILCIVFLSAFPVPLLAPSICSYHSIIDYLSYALLASLGLFRHCPFVLSPFSFFTQRPNPLPSDNHQFPLSASVSLFQLCLFCCSDATYEWNHTVFDWLSFHRISLIAAPREECILEVTFNPFMSEGTWNQSLNPESTAVPWASGGVEIPKFRKSSAESWKFPITLWVPRFRFFVSMSLYARREKYWFHLFYQECIFEGWMYFCAENYLWYIFIHIALDI